MKIWTSPFITNWNFLKNKAVLLKRFELPLSSRAELWQQCGKYCEFTWKFGLPVLSRAEVFAKIKRFSWCDLNIWHSPIITSRIFELRLLSWAEIFSKMRQFWWYNLKIWTALITSWNFCKNIPYLMKSFEHLNCPHYHEI